MCDLPGVPPPRPRDTLILKTDSPVSGNLLQLMKWFCTSLFYHLCLLFSALLEFSLFIYDLNEMRNIHREKAYNVDTCFLDKGLNSENQILLPSL